MTDHSARRIFASLVSAAYVDGLLTDDERLVLHRKATELGIPIREMNEMLAQGERGQISLGIPTSTSEREQMLESMIDVVCADGRIEAPEHHLLAKVASHLKLSLPDLRQKIKTRMETRGTRVTKVEQVPARQTRAVPAPTRPQSPPSGMPPMTVSPNIGMPLPPPPSHAPAAPAIPPAPAGPIRLDAPRLVDPTVANLPPVTLQLIRQTISFESDEASRRYVERTLDLTKEEAEKVIQAVLRAYPDLRRAAPAPEAPRPRR